MPGKENIYFVGGVNAVGKSIFLEELRKTQPEFEIFRASPHFIKWLGLEPGDYEKLRAIPDHIKNREFDRMIRSIIQGRPNKQKTFIIDAHFLNLRNGVIYDVTGD